MAVQFDGLERVDLRAVPISARVHEVLRKAITNVELLPGAPVSEKELCERYGVSRTPVREALLRLADERLVDIFPQRGTFVSRIRLDSVQDGMVIRQALERASVRRASSRATPADIAGLRISLARQRASNLAADFAVFHAEDEGFHQRIADLSGHPSLWRVVRQEKVQIDRCRVLHLPLSSRREDVIAEHAAIVDALERNDPDAAERAMHAHLAGVMPGIDELLELHPDYFDSLPNRT